MSPVHVKVGGAWKQASSVYTKVGGVWKTATDMPVKIGGVWKSGNLAVGGFESIATVTASGGETSLTFSSIPQNYVALQIRGIAKVSFTAPYLAGLYMQVNGATSGYANHMIYGDGSGAVGTLGATGQTVIDVGTITYTDSIFTNIFGACIIDIHDYASTIRNKTIRAFGGVDINLATPEAGYLKLTSGLYPSTAAVTSLTLKPPMTDRTFVAGSTFALYGIRGAS